MRDSDIDGLRAYFLEKISTSRDRRELESIRIEALGRKGEIARRMKLLSALSLEEKRSFGTALNTTRTVIEDAVRARESTFFDRETDSHIASNRVDITLPPHLPAQGTIHPISYVYEEISAIFAELGFAIAEGPHIETDFYNFTALNIPPEHPARQEHDTFYFPEDEDGERVLLRTHTSPVQIRAMREHGAPIRIIAPGRTFRCDSDQTHTPMFHQIEGLALDTDIHLGHLKWCLLEFCKAFFENDDIRMRFRPSHFPFTEPSLEVDISCSMKGGALIIGEGEGWMEILGSGMVHPNVIRAGGIDPDRYQGFAFGLGLDRLAMLKYAIPDLRAFFDGDIRWLKHYGFNPLHTPTRAGGSAR